MTRREGPRHVSSNTVGTHSWQASLEARVAAIDEEIRSLLTQPEPALQRFYGMMLYHLGLDAGRPRGGKPLRPLLCLLLFEALAGEPERVLHPDVASELLHKFMLLLVHIRVQDAVRHQ